MNNIDDLDLLVIGGGLAGSEAAWQSAQRGLKVGLFEMRPEVKTGAHISGNLAELVCSNSLGSNLPDRAPGVLKNELRRLDSLLLRCAEETAVPAGGSLAVDRDGFSELVTKSIDNHPHIQLIRQEVTEIPEKPTIIASGPLTSNALTEEIQRLTGNEHLFFYDAIAPIITLDSINMDVAYRASRYGRGENVKGDYINCPFDQGEYEAFVNALNSAERIELKEFESELESGVRAGVDKYFEGCVPVEVLSQRGRDTLAFGPLRPVGLENPRTGKRPYAVVQLRQDNLAGSLYNMVGFQTNLKFHEQRKVFQMIPGLENAEFARYGQMHRNTFIHSPSLLQLTLQLKIREKIFFAGQITGVEGYMGNVATGLLAGWNATRLIQGKPLIQLPRTTMLGALCHYITNANDEDFQPMKANFGILPPLSKNLPKGRRGRMIRYKAYADRALIDLDEYLKTILVDISHLDKRMKPEPGSG
jgi:methylenetetrahydrofolate--tRNA-(uracil-5-)-methyltransferase